VKRGALALLSTLLVLAGDAGAQGLADAGILDRPRPFEIESARLRFTWFDQAGRGFQSMAGATALGPGSQEAWIAEPQLEIVARQGERITHRMWLPVDVVSAASPDAVDAVSTASRYQEAGTIDVATTYRASRVDEIMTRFQVHLEENFRSWTLGLGWTRHVADDNAIVHASVNQTFDWFDAYLLGGANRERVGRSTTNANLAFSQILSPTTVGHLNYGLSVQNGELGNTWNTLPLADGTRDQEKLPTLRHRHALVGRLVQGLPWNGSLKLAYRFYVDGWGALAQTIEAFLYQRITRFLYVRATYRAHIQRGVDFWTDLAPLGARYRTADSDLDSFVAHTYGAKLALDLSLPRLKNFAADFSFERYVRSNDLTVNIYSCSLGFLF
jgi:hypothetical protein